MIQVGTYPDTSTKSNSSLTILTYHDIVKTQEKMNSISMTSEKRFMGQLEYISKNNYNVISFYDYRSYLEVNHPLPGNCIIITFDGPDRNWLRLAVPILLRYKFKATFFVISSWVNKVKRNISWDDLKTIKSIKNGNSVQLFDIESHSVTHALLFKNDNEDREGFSNRLEYEIGKSKEQIDNKLQQNTRFFALPFGRGDLTAVVKTVKKYNYWGIRSCDPGWQNLNRPELFNLPTDYADAIIYRPMLFGLALRKNASGDYIKLFYLLFIKASNIISKLYWLLVNLRFFVKNLFGRKN